jgi:hypothetical protein
MKSPILCSMLGLGLAGAAQSQTPAERNLLARMHSEAFEHSQAQAVFDMLTVTIGPRLTASPAYRRAAEWTRDRLASYGLENARLEPWQFGRGWTLEKLTVEMIEPRYLALVGYADGWASSTSGEIAAAPVFIGGKSPEEVEALRSKLKGAIVLTQLAMTNFVRADRPQPSDPAYVPLSAAAARPLRLPGLRPPGALQNRFAKRAPRCSSSPAAASTARCS